MKHVLASLVLVSVSMPALCAPTVEQLLGLRQFGESGKQSALMYIAGVRDVYQRELLTKAAADWKLEGTYEQKMADVKASGCVEMSADEGMAYVTLADPKEEVIDVIEKALLQGCAEYLPVQE